MGSNVAKIWSVCISFTKQKIVNCSKFKKVIYCMKILSIQCSALFIDFIFEIYCLSLIYGKNNNIYSIHEFSMSH